MMKHNTSKDMITIHIKTLTSVIDKLRQEKLDVLADMLQFGIEGYDIGDGHRCNICEQLSAGIAHRCWK